MPKINVYVSDALAERIRIAGVAISPVCQRALEEEVRRIEAQRSADEIVIQMVKRFRSTEGLTDPDDVARDADGYAAGTHWALHVASSFELAELAGIGTHGSEQIPVNRAQAGLYEILAEAGFSSDSETNRVLSASDPWGRGFLRACQELWQRVQPLMS